MIPKITASISLASFIGEPLTPFATLFAFPPLPPLPPFPLPSCSISGSSVGLGVTGCTPVLKQRGQLDVGEEKQRAGLCKHSLVYGGTGRFTMMGPMGLTCSPGVSWPAMQSQPRKYTRHLGIPSMKAPSHPLALHEACAPHLKPEVSMDGMHLQSLNLALHDAWPCPSDVPPHPLSSQLLASPHVLLRLTTALE